MEAFVLAVLLALPIRAAEGTNRLATALESGSPTDASSILDKMPGRPDSFESLFRRDSAPTLAPRATPMPRNRSTSAMDDPENWAFMTPAEVVEDFVIREVLELPQFGPDGRDRSNLSSLERLHDRVARQSQTKTAGSPSVGSMEWLGIRLSTPEAPKQSSPVESFQFEHIPSRMAPPSLENLATRRFSNVTPDNPIAESLYRAEQERFIESFRKALNPFPQELAAPGFQPVPSAGAAAGLNPNLPAPGIVERSSRTAMPQLPGVSRPNNGLPSLPTVPGVAGLQNGNEDEVDSGRPRFELPRTTPGVPQRSF